MITTTLLVALLVTRAVTATTGSGRTDRLALLDRLIIPLSGAFAVVAVLQLVDLWLSNA